MDFLVRLGEGVACLGKPLRLGEGRLRLGELVASEAYVHGLFWVGFMTRFVIVCGLLWGHCMTCLLVSLLNEE